MENVRYCADNFSSILTSFRYNLCRELLCIRLEGIYWNWSGHFWQQSSADGNYLSVLRTRVAR